MDNFSNSAQPMQKHWLGLGFLALMALILGTIPVAVKQAMLSISPALEFALRFVIGALVLTPFARRPSLALLRDGIGFGLLLAVIFAAATIGLETVAANRASFFFALTMVFVTAFTMLFRGRRSWRQIWATALGFTGMVVMSWQTGEPVVGNIWLLVYGVADAAYTICLEPVAPRHEPITFTVVQLWVVAFCGVAWALPDLPQQWAAVETNWLLLMYLGVVATGLLMLLQITAQRWIVAEQAALLFALEPICGGLFAFWLLGEVFSVQGWVGAVMILGGIGLILRETASPKQLVPVILLSDIGSDISSNIDSGIDAESSQEDPELLEIS
ncbi:MAG: DMT family transporter [Pseudanabaenaceae cyanobacterium]|jgi:drug/metabolite transporter (DMT)-like permease